MTTEIDFWQHSAANRRFVPDEAGDASGQCDHDIRPVAVRRPGNAAGPLADPVAT